MPCSREKKSQVGPVPYLQFIQKKKRERFGSYHKTERCIATIVQGEKEKGKKSSET